MKFEEFIFKNALVVKPVYGLSTYNAKTRVKNAPRLYTMTTRHALWGVWTSKLEFVRYFQFKQDVMDAYPDLFWTRLSLELNPGLVRLRSIAEEAQAVDQYYDNLKTSSKRKGKKPVTTVEVEPYPPAPVEEPKPVNVELQAVSLETIHPDRPEGKPEAADNVVSISLRR